MITNKKNIRDLHSNMVRFIIITVLPVNSQPINLHSNMVRFIIFGGFNRFPMGAGFTFQYG